MAARNAEDTGTSILTHVNSQFPRESMIAAKSGEFVFRTCELTAILELPSAVLCHIPQNDLENLGNGSEERGRHRHFNPR